MNNQQAWEKEDYQQSPVFVKSAENHFTRGNETPQINGVRESVLPPERNEQDQMQSVNTVELSSDRSSTHYRLSVVVDVIASIFRGRLLHRVMSSPMTNTILRVVPMAEFWNIVWLWKNTLAAHSHATKQFTISMVISRTIAWKTYSFATDDTGKVRLLAVPTAGAPTS